VVINPSGTPRRLVLGPCLWFHQTSLAHRHTHGCLIPSLVPRLTSMAGRCALLLVCCVHCACAFYDARRGEINILHGLSLRSVVREGEGEEQLLNIHRPLHAKKKEREREKENDNNEWTREKGEEEGGEENTNKHAHEHVS